MKGLQHIQFEVGEWSQNQFGQNMSQVTGEYLYSQPALTGIVEEVGELNHVTICTHQGRRGYDQILERIAKYKADRDDALANILIFMCDYAHREGTDLLALLNQTWDRVVSKRMTENWDQHSHKTSGATISEERMKEEANQLPTVTEKRGREPGIVRRSANAEIKLRQELEQNGVGWAESKEQV